MEMADTTTKPAAVMRNRIPAHRSFHLGFCTAKASSKVGGAP